jgi:P-type Ca2+ transporter type 2C
MNIFFHLVVTVREIFTLAYRTSTFGLTGAGYSAISGQLLHADKIGNYLVNDSDTTFNNRTITKDSDEFVAIEALFHTGCLCNNATIPDSFVVSGFQNRSKLETHTNPMTATKLSGQPTEIAILVASHKAQLGNTRSYYQRVHEVPFSSERKYMKVQAFPINESNSHVCKAFDVVGTGNGSNNNNNCMTFLKGMPENVIKECTTYCLPDGTLEQLSEDDRRFVIAEARKMASNALRVIGFAYGRTILNGENDDESCQHQLTFAGLMGIEDPPRLGVPECVRNLRRGGIKVLMITGDSRETAVAIAKRCNIVDDDGNEPPASIAETISTPTLECGDNGVTCMSGADIDSMNPTDLVATICNVSVFYRVSPRHKLAIVRACKFL